MPGTYDVGTQELEEHRHYVRIICFAQCAKVERSFRPSVRE